MGWSCSAKTHNTLQRLWALQDKTTATIKQHGKEYFAELSTTEHADGSATGAIYMLVERIDAITSKTTKTGAFKIDGGTGLVTRGPKWMMDALNWKDEPCPVCGRSRSVPIGHVTCGSKTCLQKRFETLTES